MNLPWRQLQSDDRLKSGNIDVQVLVGGTLCLTLAEDILATNPGKKKYKEIN